MKGCDPVRKTVLGLTMAAAIGGTAGAGMIDPGRFAWIKPVDPVSGAPAELAKVLLDPEIYAVAALDYHDLRLADAEGQEQPWLIRPRTVNRRQVRPVAHSARMVHLRELPDNRLELTLKVEAAEGVLFSALRLHTGLRDFEKEVSIWAGPEGETWTPVAEGAVIYDYARFADVRCDRVDFPPQAGPWFKVEIATGQAVQEAPGWEATRQTRGADVPTETERRNFQRIPFRMDSAELIEMRETAWERKAATETRAVTNYTVASLDAESATAIEWPGGRLPVQGVELDFEDVNFVRPVSVLARNADAAEWRPVAEATLHRIQIGRARDARLRVDFPGEHRWDEYRLLIRHQDNPPLTVRSVMLHLNQHELLFLPKTTSSYRLFYGGEGLPRPLYDIGQVLARADPEVGQEWRFAPGQANPDFRRGVGRGWWERNARALVRGALVVTVLILLLILGLASRRLSALSSRLD